MIDIKIDRQGITAAIERIARQQRAPLMANVAAIMADAVEENFAQEGRPKWQGLKPPGRPGGKILQASGQLAASIDSDSDADSAVVGSNKKYAAIHQFGGGTRAHEIRPRNKKALAFGGRVVAKVNHPGSVIPARPFLALTPGDEAEIEQTALDYLQSLVGK